VPRCSCGKPPEVDLSFVGLIGRNLWARKARTLFTSLAVALGVMTVVTLGVATQSFRATATGVLSVGTSDFSVAQRDASEVLNSVVSEDQVRRLGGVPGVQSAVGVLGTVTKLDASHPLFIEIGVAPDHLAEFGVRIVDGRAFDPTAKHEMMLGSIAAADLDEHVGDTLSIDDIRYRVVGVFRISGRGVAQSYANAASMFPLVPLQGRERKSGLLTLAFVRVEPGASVAAVRARIQHEFPQLATVSDPSEAGLVDSNLALFSAVEHASSLIAVVVGGVIVMNTMLLSFFQRTREFGVLRAVGWSRRRLIALVTAEAAVIGVAGAGVGVALSFGALRILEDLPSLAGLLDPRYDAGLFVEALYVAAATVLLGAVYPTLRAALLVPLAALRRE
jgi:putative ABC transport system permease protein